MGLSWISMVSLHEFTGFYSDSWGMNPHEGNGTKRDAVAQTLSSNVAAGKSSN